MMSRQWKNRTWWALALVVLCLIGACSGVGTDDGLMSYEEFEAKRGSMRPNSAFEYRLSDLTPSARRQFLDDLGVNAEDVDGDQVWTYVVKSQSYDNSAPRGELALCVDSYDISEHSYSCSTPDVQQTHSDYRPCSAYQCDHGLYVKALEFYTMECSNCTGYLRDGTRWFHDLDGLDPSIQGVF